MQRVATIRRRWRGLSIVEALLALVVLQVAVLSVSYAVGAGTNRGDDAETDMLRVEAAETLLERILALPVDDPQGPTQPGPEPGETPETFDNTDDYHGFTDELPARPSDPRVLRRVVAVTAERRELAGLGAAVDGMLVTVTVDGDDVRPWSLTRFVPGGAR
ncbi:MAG: hypothetical protein HKO59_01105 [Phycisphaerales bacterium]|nr:hypothetical protein [Phycisphaerae bacterium]NNF41627.1 hypothetical protein [Phycisphaerales bacterium]NNM24577.1 hypothetical protein [Phycisphaerales bacterium]